MKHTKEYTVKLDVFEGPLDLLLFLVNKAEVPIVDISVSEIAKQYMHYIELMQELNIIIASEYLYMAATLVRLKAQEMLPDGEPEAVEEAEEIVNRQQLIEKLLEYKKYKEAAHSLKLYEGENYGTYTRGLHEQIETLPDNQNDLCNVTIFDLISAFQRVIERANQDPDPVTGHVLQPDDVKLDDRIEFILGTLEDVEEVSFTALFGGHRVRLVLVVTFMAILELVKMKRIKIRQENCDSELYVRRNQSARPEPIGVGTREHQPDL